MKPTTKQRRLIERVLGGIAFEFPAGKPADCCLAMLAAWAGRKAAGARRECLECGALAKAVILDRRPAGPNDLLACGPISALAIDAEEPVELRVAGLFLAKEAPSRMQVLADVGLDLDELEETEHGLMAGTMPDAPLVAPLAAGALAILEAARAGD